MVHVASGGIFCLRHPNHPFCEELDRVTNQVTS
jgi:MinD-like ATPase involved in chromosome partitioning or flagellar assembly